MFHSDYTIGCDAHKHYSFFAVLDSQGHVVEEQRIAHQPGVHPGLPLPLPSRHAGRPGDRRKLVLPVGHRDGVDRR